MPFFEAFATAGCRGMLGDKDGMVFHGGFTTVILGTGRSQTQRNDLAGMPGDRFDSVFFQKPGFFGVDMKSGAEFGLG